MLSTPPLTATAISPNPSSTATRRSLTGIGGTKDTGARPDPGDAASGMGGSGARAERDDIGSFGNDRDRGVAGPCDAFAHGLVERVDDVHAGYPLILRRKPFGKQLDPADAHRLELHFGLPFVDIGQGLALDAAQEGVRPQLDQPFLRRPELRRADALSALGRDD